MNSTSLPSRRLGSSLCEPGQRCTCRVIRLSMSNRRTLNDIQSEVAKRGRNAVSRFIPVRVDKNKIAAWRQGLARALQAFDVRSIGSTGDSRTYHPSPLKTEPAFNTHTMIADIRRDVLGENEGTSDQSHSVSVTCYLSTPECLSLLDSSEVSDTKYYGGLRSYFLIAPILVNYLPRRRGTFSDATSSSTRVKISPGRTARS